MPASSCDRPAPREMACCLLQSAGGVIFEQDVQACFLDGLRAGQQKHASMLESLSSWSSSDQVRR